MSFNLRACGHQIHKKSWPPDRACIPSSRDLNSQKTAQTACSSEPSVSGPPIPEAPQPPRGALCSPPANSPAKEREPTGVHSARNPRGCQVPSGVLGRASEITAGQDGEALPYPPARPWSRGRGNREVAGTAAAPLRSRCQPPQAREDLSPGRKRDVPPTAPGEDQIAPGTGARPPTPRPADAPPPGQAPPLGSGSVGALAPPTASGAELVKVVVRSREVACQESPRDNLEVSTEDPQPILQMRAAEDPREQV